MVAKTPITPTQRRRRIRRAIAAGSVLAAGVLGFAVQHGNVTRSQKPQQEMIRVEKNRAITRAAEDERNAQKEIEWSVYANARGERKPTAVQTREFDRMLDSEMKKWKEAMKGEEARQPGIFVENTTEQNLNKIIRLTEKEIREQIAKAYERDPAFGKRYAEYAVAAKKELENYLNQRVERIREEAAKAATPKEKKALQELARVARMSALRVGGMSAAAALLAYAMILQGYIIYQAQQRRNQRRQH